MSQLYYLTNNNKKILCSKYYIQYRVKVFQSQSWFVTNKLLDITNKTNSSMYQQSYNDFNDM